MLSHVQHCDSLCLLSNPRLSGINTGLMNNSETNKNGTRHTHTQNTLRSSSDWSARDKTEPRGHWPSLGERTKPIGQLGVTKRTAVTAA